MIILLIAIEVDSKLRQQHPEEILQTRLKINLFFLIMMGFTRSSEALCLFYFKSDWNKT